MRAAHPPAGFSYPEGAAVILREFVKTERTPSKLRHVRMREGEKPGVNLVADMSYWTSVGMKAEVSFEESVCNTIDYMRTLPAQELANAAKFYWGH